MKRKKRLGNSLCSLFCFGFCFLVAVYIAIQRICVRSLVCSLCVLCVRIEPRICIQEYGIRNDVIFSCIFVRVASVLKPRNLCFVWNVQSNMSIENLQQQRCEKCARISARGHCWIYGVEFICICEQSGVEILSMFVTPA